MKFELAIAVLLTVGMFAGASAFSGIGETVDDSLPVGETGDASVVNYSFDPTCHNYTTLGGGREQSCSAHLVIRNYSDRVAHIRVRAATWSGDTQTWVIHEERFPMLIHQIRSGGLTFELWVGDLVVVTAVFENGSTTIIEHHEFACEDIEVGQRCSYEV